MLCLLRGTIRTAGAAMMAAGFVLAMLLPPPAPDILIERAGANVAVRNADGLLVPAVPRRARFTVEKWLSADGDEAPPGEAAKRKGWTCAATRCDTTVKGKRLAYVLRAEGKPIDCAGLAILISDAPLRGACRSVPLRIDRFDLWRNGAHALTVTPDRTLVSTARGAEGQRPWTVVPERRVRPAPAPSTRAFGPH